MINKLLSIRSEEIKKYENAYDGYNYLRYIKYSYHNDFTIEKEFTEHIVSFMFVVFRNYIKSIPRFSKYESGYLCALNRKYAQLTMDEKEKIIKVYVEIAKYTIMLKVMFDMDTFDVIYHMSELMNISIKTSHIVETLLSIV